MHQLRVLPSDSSPGEAEKQGKDICGRRVKDGAFSIELLQNNQQSSMNSRQEEPSLRELAKPTLKRDLKHIVQLTEENETETPLTPEIQKEQTNCIIRSLRCLRTLWNGRTGTAPKLAVDTKQKDFRAILSQIRNSKQVYRPILTPQKHRRKVLVLDLDGTLVHTTFSKPPAFDFQLQVLFNGKKTKIFTSKRFGLDSFLFEMSQLYELVVFTISPKSYGDKILDLIDPKHRIAHRLYRCHCLLLNKTHHLKDVRVLGRPMEDIVVVDDSQMAGLLQPDHFYQIQSYQGSPKDRQLCRLAAFLKYLHPKQQMHPIHDQRRQFEEMEIELAQDRHPVQRKRMQKHKKRNSQLESLAAQLDKAEEQTATSQQPHDSL